LWRKGRHHAGVKAEAMGMPVAMDVDEVADMVAEETMTAVEEEATVHHLPF
jgi:hypothetical protein